MPQYSSTTNCSEIWSYHLKCACMCSVSACVRREREGKEERQIVDKWFCKWCFLSKWFCQWYFSFTFKGRLYYTGQRTHINFLTIREQKFFPSEDCYFSSNKNRCGEVQVGSSRQRPGILLNRLQCTGRSLLQNYLSPSVNSATSVKC